MQIFQIQKNFNNNSLHHSEFWILHSFCFIMLAAWRQITNAIAMFQYSSHLTFLLPRMKPFLFSN